MTKVLRVVYHAEIELPDAIRDEAHMIVAVTSKVLDLDSHLIETYRAKTDYDFIGVTPKRRKEDPPARGTDPTVTIDETKIAVVKGEETPSAGDNLDIPPFLRRTTDRREEQPA